MFAIFKYFWFIAAIVMFINVMIWKHRLRGSVERGIVTQAEVDQFLRWATACLVGGPLIVGAIALAAGWPSPFCVIGYPVNTTGRALTPLLMIASPIALLWWVWRGNGADFLARIGPALSNTPSYDRQFTPASVRLVVTALVLVSVISTPLAWRSLPPSPGLGCTTSP